MNFGDVRISYGVELTVELTLDAWQQARPAIRYLEHKLTDKREEIRELKSAIAEHELYTKWKEGEPARKNAIRRAKYANKRDAEQIRINEEEEMKEYEGSIFDTPN
jgi:trimethylamine:corrinoid methyltransferase-like protein